jgi:pyrroline-5-carboxylate reductase
MKVKKVVRVMPNLALKEKSALCGWIANSEVTGDEKSFMKELLKMFGEEVEVKNEEAINMITALSGSGPAYFYYLTECLAQKALKYGFGQEDAQKIARTTFLGAAKLLEASRENVSELRHKITSKGGTTEAAIKKLEEKDFEKIFYEALNAAKIRAEELNN